MIAVGTTVVRALETVADESGETHPGAGWTSLVIAADRPLRIVTGLITGLHEASASHMALITAVVNAISGNQQVLQRAYAEARERRYLRHEFGDSHLIIDSGAPGRQRVRDPSIQ